MKASRRTRVASTFSTLLVGAALGVLTWFFVIDRDVLGAFSSRTAAGGPRGALAFDQTVVLMPLAVSLATLVFRWWWARSGAWPRLGFWVAAPLGGLTLAGISGGLFGGFLVLYTLARAFTQKPLPTVHDVLMTVIGAQFFSLLGVFFGFFYGALSLAFLPVGALLVLWMRRLDAVKAS